MVVEQIGARRARCARSRRAGDDGDQRHDARRRGELRKRRTRARRDPLAWLADHVSRKRIVVLSLLGGGVALALTGFVVNPFQLFWALSAVGFAAAYGIPVFGSLMADAYPIHGRSRVFALFFMAQPLGQLIGPFLVGFIADEAGGREGWRWVYFILAIPTALLGLVAARFLREPARGRYEEELVLGGQLQRADGERELPVTISTAYQRMKKIKTFYYICVGIGVLGFAFVAVPIQLGLLFRRTPTATARTRGVGSPRSAYRHPSSRSRSRDCSTTAPSAAILSASSASPAA